MKEIDKKIDKKMLQNSLLCGPKGAVNFAIGSFTLLNGFLVNTFNPGQGKQQMEGGLYAMYNNAVPLLEVLVMMGLVMPLLKRFYNLFLPYNIAVAASLLSCWGLMVSVCLTLRALDLRQDCCSVFNYEETFKNEYGATVFKIPSDESKRNSLLKFLPQSWKSSGDEKNWFEKMLSYDRLKKKIIGEKGSQTGYAKNSLQGKNARVINVVFRVITAPLFALSLLIKLFELIPRLALDTYDYIQRKGIESDKQEVVEGENENTRSSQSGNRCSSTAGDAFDATGTFFKKDVIFTFSRLLPYTPQSLENVVINNGCLCNKGREVSDQS